MLATTNHSANRSPAEGRGQGTRAASALGPLSIERTLGPFPLSHTLGGYSQRLLGRAPIHVRQERVRAPSQLWGPLPH